MKGFNEQHQVNAMPILWEGFGLPTFYPMKSVLKSLDFHRFSKFAVERTFLGITPRY